MPSKPIYKVIFLNQGKVYEIYARHVSQTGTLFGFVEVEEIVFDARKGVVVDPSEERLQIEFAGVKKTYLPMHYVLRIDEVEKSVGWPRKSTVTGFGTFPASRMRNITAPFLSARTARSDERGSLALNEPPDSVSASDGSRPAAD